MYKNYNQLYLFFPNQHDRNYANQMIRFRFGEQCQMNKVYLLIYDKFYTNQNLYANMSKNPKPKPKTKHEYEYEYEHETHKQLCNLCTQKKSQIVKKYANFISLFLNAQTNEQNEPKKYRKHFKPLNQNNNK